MVINAIVAVFELVRSEVKKRHQKKSPVGFPQVIFWSLEFVNLSFIKRRILLTEEIEHHSRVGAGVVRACEVMPGVLISDYGALYIFHGIERYLVALSEQRI